MQEVEISLKIADLNIVNLARATLGSVQGVDVGAATDEAHEAALGSLLRLAHIGPAALTLKKGANAANATAVAAAGNYEVRPEGVYILPQAADIQAGDKLWISYSWADQAVIEALTAKSVELELVFGGLNEADGGKPCVVDVWRVSQSVAKQLALINDKFGALEVSGSVLQDPRRSGAGISRYYRQTVA